MANLNQEGISSESVCDFDLFDNFSDKLDITRTEQFSTYDYDCEQLDLYTDLFTSDLHEKSQNAKKALDDCQKLESENLKLQNKLQEITSNLEILKKQNFILKYNISSLYKTAKEEIDRKDLYIQELRESLDHMIFRRRKGLEKLTNNGSFKNDYEDRLERNHGEPQVLKQKHIIINKNKIIKNEDKFYHHSDKDKQKYHDKELHSNPENISENFKTHSLLPTSKSFKNSMKTSLDSKTKHSREMNTYHKNHQRDDRKIKSKERRHNENLVSSKRSKKEYNERFSKKENTKYNITNEKHHDTTNRTHKEKSNRESIKTNLNAKEKNNKKRI